MMICTKTFVTICGRARRQRCAQPGTVRTYSSEASQSNTENSRYRDKTHLTDTPTSSCFCLQCDTSELKARNSNLHPRTCQPTTLISPTGVATHTTCSTLTSAVIARKYGFVSTSMRLTSSSSAPDDAPCCFAASAKLAVIAAKIVNFQYDIGWNSICSGTLGVVELISKCCERRCQNSFGKIMGL